ncbi:MAG: hypothetical protein Q9214_004089 [Letrouitia sp. 1 TL-2023]
MLLFLAKLGKRESSTQSTAKHTRSTESVPSNSTLHNTSQGNSDTLSSTALDSNTESDDGMARSTPASHASQPRPRSLRQSRSTVASYNENILSGSAKPARRKNAESFANRTVSGETLVNEKSESPTEFVRQKAQGLDQNWTLGSLPGDNLELGVHAEEAKRRKSTRLAVFEIASNLVEQTKTVLGKRSRDTIEAGKGTPRKDGLGDVLQPREKTPSDGPQQKKARFAHFSGSGELSPHGLSKTEPKPARRPSKRWLGQGLFVGQDPDFDPRYTTSRNLKKKATKQEKGETTRQRSILPLPMFAGRRALEIGADFRLPFDVFSPLPPGQPRPDEWKKTHKSQSHIEFVTLFANLEYLDVFVGDAAAIWRKSKLLEASKCICTTKRGCDEDCFNRLMLYECDDSNCNIGAENCNNRSFEDLRRRCKVGGKYNLGVEVIKTQDRGHGVRSNRTFDPNQIIVEYTGEIITQDECDNRMETRYKDSECFYLMEFDQSMILDATRGSIARFINHSCEPNCKMQKWTVAGKPRMALFAGENGIMTGEELTYDYNFSPYSVKNVQECRCGAPSCRGVLGPKPKEIKDALKPLTTGGKRKLEQAFQDSFQAVTKKRKINVPSSLKTAFSTAKAQTREKFTKARDFGTAKVKSEKLVRKALTCSSKTKENAVLLDRKGGRRLKESSSVTYASHSSKRGTLVKDEADDEQMPISRKSSVKATATSVRKNMVRTVRRSGVGARRNGKSIRVVEDGVRKSSG